MYINCGASKKLTLDYVSQAPAGDLHSFKWTDKAIGSLPATFNALVGYYDLDDPRAVHFTDGGPWLAGYEDVPYAEEWRTVYNETQRSK
jgi:hypothetical protein